MEKTKTERIIYVVLGVIMLCFVTAYWGFPDFIGENEMDLFDIVSMRTAFYFAIVICAVLVFLRSKYKIDTFESRAKNEYVRQITNVLLYPIISVMLSFTVLFDCYSFSNYCFTKDKEVLTGEIYKMDITKVSKGPDKLYVYFNEMKKYRLRVSEENYSKYKEGDKINLKVRKGRFVGYYLINKL